MQRCFNQTASALSFGKMLQNTLNGIQSPLGSAVELSASRLSALMALFMLLYYLFYGESQCFIKLHSSQAFVIFIQANQVHSRAKVECIQGLWIQTEQTSSFISLSLTRLVKQIALVLCELLAFFIKSLNVFQFFKFLHYFLHYLQFSCG